MSEESNTKNGSWNEITPYSDKRSTYIGKMKLKDLPDSPVVMYCPEEFKETHPEIYQECMDSLKAYDEYWLEHGDEYRSYNSLDKK